MQHALYVPAVHEHRSHVLRPRLGGCSDEGQDGQSVFWDAHIRPLSIVIVEDRVFFPLRSLEDQNREYYESFST